MNLNESVFWRVKMLKNPLSYKFGNEIIKQEQVVRLHQMNRIFDKEIKINVVSKIISLVLITVSFLIEFPKDPSEWIMKGAEIIAIVIAVYAFSLGISHAIKRRKMNADKTLLEVEAKRKNLSLEKYIIRYVEMLSDSIETWAKFHKIKFKYTRHNHLRNVIDFYDFPIDYIDINVVNYRLFFTIRVNDLDLLNKISEDLPRNCKNLVLVIDKYHIGPKESLAIDEEGMMDAKEMIISIVLSKVYNTVYF